MQSAIERDVSISIHAPRTGSDLKSVCYGRIYYISIHAPRTGSDRNLQLIVTFFLQFQSTLPARGATAAGFAPCRTFVFQSTLPARGATVNATAAASRRKEFQSTLPARGATGKRDVIRRALEISIHAPRTGSDSSAIASVVIPITISIHAPRTGSDPRRAIWTRRRAYFNPRSPHGERPNILPTPANHRPFQSTLPARGATRIYK